MLFAKKLASAAVQKFHCRIQGVPTLYPVQSQHPINGETGYSNVLLENWPLANWYGIEYIPMVDAHWEMYEQ